MPSFTASLPSVIVLMTVGRFNERVDRRPVELWLGSPTDTGNGSGGESLLMTKRAVPAGTELLTRYGTQYWQRHE